MKNKIVISFKFLILKIALKIQD